MSLPMASFGENLRREREMRGVTLEEISHATKIGVRTLEALELENFSKLPGGIFTRSFIRAYARYIGLDEEKVMAEFQLVAPQPREPDLSRVVLMRPVVPREGSRTPLLVFLVAAALLGGGVALYRYSRGGTGAQESTVNARRVSAEPAPSAPQPSQVSSPPTSATPATSPNARPVSQDTPATVSAATLTAPTSADLTLQVAATERTWVAVEADGKVVLQRELEPHEFQTLKAKGSFDVLTRNAQGLILTLNDETLKPLGRRGEVKKVHLTRNDLKTSTP